MKNLLLSALFVSALFVSCTTDENENVIKTNPGTNAGITTSSVYSKA